MSHEHAQQLADRAELEYHHFRSSGLATAQDHREAAARAEQVVVAEETRLNSGELPRGAYICCLRSINRARSLRAQHERIAHVFGQVETLFVEVGR